MLKKTDVYDFIDSMKNKKLKEVKEQYAIELANVIESTLNEQENHAFRDAIKSYEHHIAEGVKAQTVIRKYIPRADEYLRNKDTIKNLLGYNSWYFPKGFPTILAVHAEWESKIEKINEEYERITNMCKRKKTGEQGKTALIALGFNVEYLDNLSNFPVVVNEATFTIDKSLIFTCEV